MANERRLCACARMLVACVAGESVPWLFCVPPALLLQFFWLQSWSLLLVLLDSEYLQSASHSALHPPRVSCPHLEVHLEGTTVYLLNNIETAFYLALR